LHVGGFRLGRNVNFLGIPACESRNTFLLKGLHIKNKFINFAVHNSQVIHINHFFGLAYVNIPDLLPQ